MPDEPVVMLTAYRDASFGPVSTTTAVHFRVVTLNIGNAYDILSSQFVAPVDGFYWFGVTIHGDRSSSYIAHFRLVLNCVEVGRFLGQYSSASGGIHIRLSQGDKVWVELTEEDAGRAYCLETDMRCFFTGRLIQTGL